MIDRRSKNRKMVDQYQNVEITIDGMAPAYVFKLRDISSMGMGVLVKEDSDLLNQIEIGQIVNMKYNPAQRSNSSKYFKTEIKHITKDAQGRFKGHFIIGLAVIESIKEIF